jgi:hypothetical protein
VSASAGNFVTYVGAVCLHSFLQQPQELIGLARDLLLRDASTRAGRSRETLGPLSLKLGTMLAQHAGNHCVCHRHPLEGCYRRALWRHASECGAAIRV